MSVINHAERIIIANHVYGTVNSNGSLSAPNGYSIEARAEVDSGLEIYALKKIGTNEIVFAVRGSDDELDWTLDGPNASHFLGKVHVQDKEALKFVDKFVDDSESRGEKYNYSVAGDSKGGAIAQIIAWTFGFGGTTTEAAAGGGVINDPAYLEVVKELESLDGHPVGIAAGRLVNVLESGSIVSPLSSLWFGVEHIGITLSLDTVPADTSTTLSNLIVSQHTTRDERIELLKSCQSPDGIDPLIVLLNKKITDFSEMVEALRDEIADEAAKKLIEDGGQSGLVQLEAECATYEMALLDLLTARDRILIDTYGSEEGVDPWIRQALENALPVADQGDEFGPDAEVSLLPLQFQVPGDGAVYVLTATGLLTKVASGTNAAVVLNLDNPPQGTEELIEQLQALGLSPDQVTALVAQSGFVQLADSIVHAQEVKTGIHDYQVQLSESIRVADLSVLQAQQGLLDAVQAGDIVTTVRAVFSYYEALQVRSSLSGIGTTGETSAWVQRACAAIDGIMSLGQALDQGDGWSIVRESADLLQQIDRYLLENGHDSLLANDDLSAFSVGSAGIGLAEALEDGDGWGIAQSTTQLLGEIDRAIDISTASSITSANGVDVEVGTGTTALQGVASAIGLVMNLSRLDDALDSGDAGAIVSSAAGTAHYAVSTYNSVATLTGNSSATISGPGLSYVGYAAAAVQLAQGDARGAGITAASTYLMCCVPYGWIFALVLQLGSMLSSDDDPPEATARFSVDQDGSIVMHVSGDSEMRDAADGYGRSLIPVFEDYRQSGGRLLIDGSLPSLTIVAGEPGKINYDDTHGGIIEVRIDDLAEVGNRLRGVLYARDRGERLDSAIQLTKGDFGEIDIARVDAVMAGYGFVREGLTYISGETTSRVGTTIGSGVMHGGGNQGPSGRIYTANKNDITSLPLPPDQLPSQQLGEITRIAGLNSMFSGSGAKLLAMAMILPGGMQDMVSARCEVAVQDDLGTGVEQAFGDGWHDADMRALPFPDDSGGEEHLPPSTPTTMSDGASLTPPSGLPAAADSQEVPLRPPEALRIGNAYYFQGSDADAYNQPPTSSTWVNHGWQAELDELQLLRQDSVATEDAATMQGTAVFSGYRSKTMQDDAAGENGEGAGDSANADHYLGPEPSFVMAEDTTLRILPAELLEDVDSGSSMFLADQAVLLSFDQAENGTVWLDGNGDVRFQPASGFAGDASFSYTVREADGTIHRRQAEIAVANVNDFPSLENDYIMLQEGEPFALDRLLDNDHDPDGDPLVIDHLRGIEHGEIGVVDGRAAFIPEAGFTGTIEFSYWVRDYIDTYPVMATATLAYQDINTGPAAGADRFLILEDSSLVTSVETLLANDVEYDGEQIDFVACGPALHGTVHMDQIGEIIFTPQQDYAGCEAGFSYQIKDDTGNCSTGWVAVEVQNSREAPVVTATTGAPINEDEILVFTPATVATFVADADGDDLYLDLISNIIGGSIAVVDGYYAFVPDPDYAGPASFDYRANDNHGGTVEGHLAFSITPVNDPIVAGDDFLVTMEETAVAANVADLLANDIDVDGSGCNFVSLGDARYGSVTMDADGVVSFTPETDYWGSEAGFTYIVMDDEGALSTGWVGVDVTPANDPPIMSAESLELLEDEPLVFNQETLSQIVFDADGDQLIVGACAALAGGTVDEAAGVYRFVPDADYHGAGLVELSVTDESGAMVSGVLALTIMPVDDPTVFASHRLTTDEERAVSLTVAELLSGDSDVDGGLTFIGLGSASYGSVVLTDQGSVVFTPTTDYFGDAAGFSYLVADSENNMATGWVTVDVGTVNDEPECVADTLAGREDEPLLFTAETIAKFLHDPDGDPVTITSLSAAAGQIEESGGQYTFVPDLNYHGSYLLSICATDGNGGQVSTQLQLMIASVDDPTSFGNDLFVTLEEQPLGISCTDLLANDYDADGPLAFVALGSASYGQVTLDQFGSIEFLPETDYFGDRAGFSYTVRDAEGHLADGWVTVQVVGITEDPVVVADRLFINEDQPLAFTAQEISRFLYDPDGSAMSLTAIDQVRGGRITAEGSLFTFLPDSDWYGEASLSYRSANAAGREVSGTLAIGVLPVNDLPEVAAQSLAGTEDQETIVALVDLLSGAVDIEDGSDLCFYGFTASSNGDVYLDTEGFVHFLPDDDYYGDASFSYSVVDSEGGLGIGQVELDIAAVPDPPVAVDDERIVAWSNDGYQNTWTAAVLLANDYDPDGDQLFITAVGPARFGTVTLNTDGTISYVAASADWVGVDSFSYQVQDAGGATAEAQGRLDVKINTSPDLCGELVTSAEDEIVTLSAAELLANDHDIDGDPLAIVGVTAGTHCDVTLQDDGSVLFRPELNYNNCYPGQAWFTYTVSDGISEPVSAASFFAIEPVNDKPVLTPERIDGAVEDNGFVFRVADILTNDTDVELASPYEQDEIFFAGLGNAAHGAITCDLDSGMIFYQPDPDFFGTDSFSYRVVDTFGAESTVSSEIRVAGVNDLPVVEEDIGSPAEEYVWNYYSIAGLLRNDSDVDGDTLTISAPHVVSGNAQVSISGGNLAVKPAIGTSRVVIDYTVSDGNGGEVGSRLTIPQIIEHNFAPRFTNLYEILLYVNIGGNHPRTDFSFQVVDENGGDNWQVGSAMGDIATISAGRLRTNYPGAELIEISNTGDFRFHYDAHDLDESIPYYATFTITAADYAGATGTIFVDYDRLATGKGTYTYQYNPVVFDLDDDGIELLAIDQQPRFDWNGSGEFDVSGWVGSDDGFLVYDYDGDRLVSWADELSLVNYAPDAVTDLQGLTAFDSNQNGLFDTEDEQWLSFGVWQDRNGNGSTDAGEFRSLDEHGIMTVDLHSNEFYQEIEGNQIYGTTICKMADGSELTAADVGLRGGEIDAEETQTLAAHPEASEQPESVEQATDISDAELDRLVVQLQSDIAAGSVDDSDIVSYVPIDLEPDCGLDMVISDPDEQAAMAIA